MTAAADACLLAVATSLLVLGAPAAADVGGTGGAPPVVATDAAETVAGHGFVLLSFQAFETSGSFGHNGDVLVPFTSTEAQAALIEFNYAVDDRWHLYVGVPYMMKRFQGGHGHDPALINPPQDAQYIDDGDYHGGFQDWRVGADYYLHGQLWEMVPYARLEIPSRDYPHYASAAIGQNVARFEIGVDYVRHLPFTPLYYRVGYSYTFVEETLGVNVNYNRLPVQLGYFFTPRFGADIFAEGRFGKGRDSEQYACAVQAPNGQCLRPVLDATWYQHDRQLKHNYVTAGIGINYALTGRQTLRLSTWEMVWGRSVHKLEHAGQVTMSQRF